MITTTTNSIEGRKMRIPRACTGSDYGANVSRLMAGILISHRCRSAPHESNSQMPVRQLSRNARTRTRQKPQTRRSGLTSTKVLGANNGMLMGPQPESRHT